KNGETLWSISQQYGVPVNSLIQVNQLNNPNQLQIGNMLIIPPIIHRVESGETLSQLATQYGTTVDAILSENQIQAPNMIQTGSQLIIPRPKPLIEVNAYTYQSPSEAADSINQVGELLTYVSPFAYQIGENGELSPVQDAAIITEAKTHNITPMMLITNFSSTTTGFDLAPTILADPKLREQTSEHILTIMDEKGYKGLNSHFENVLPGDRELYNQFL